MLKVKLQYFGHLMRRTNWLEKTLLLEKLRAGGEGATEDHMVGWHHWLNGHEFEQSPGDGEGQGSLACCSPWGCKESDMTEVLNNNKNQNRGITRDICKDHGLGVCGGRDSGSIDQSYSRSQDHCMAQQTLVHQKFAFPSSCKLSLSPLKYQIITLTPSYVFPKDGIFKNLDSILKSRDITWLTEVCMI